MTRNIKAVITEILQKMKEYLYSKKTVFYINSPQTLPPPLGIQEETQLVEEYRQGTARCSLLQWVPLPSITQTMLGPAMSLQNGAKQILHTL